MKCHMPEEEPKINGNIQMNMYDLNKQFMSQLATLSDEDLENSREVIRKYFQTQQNEYYMLLCKDISYYTLFHINNKITEPAAADEVIECIKCIGAVKAVDLTEGESAIEIWVQEDGRDPMVMYLFTYDTGVIECAL